jgi:hypothetical protein
MSPSQLPDRVNAGDADKILALAAALDQRSAERLDGALSLVDLEAAAAGAGIDPVRVREAAAILARERAAAGPARFVGAPMEIVRECELPGELDESHDAEWTELVRRLTGRHGHFERAGRSATWWTRKTASSLRVTITSSRGVIRIRIAQHHSEYVYSVHVGMMSGPGIAGGIGSAVATIALGGPALLAAGVGAALLGGAYALGRRVVRRGVSRDAAGIDALLAELVDFVAAHATPAAAAILEPPVL